MDDNVISKDSVTQAVDVLLKVLQTEKEKPNKSKRLLSSDEEELHLFIILKKIPHAKQNHVKVSRVSLPFSIYSETSTVCLFVKDEEKGKDIDDDVAKHHYRELLQSNQVSGIDEIIPLHQLRAEFKPFEAKRRLCCSYDLFLTDARIVSFLPSLIGKAFWIKKRLPVKVNMLAKDLKQEFQKVLSSTYLYVNGRGSCNMMPISTSAKSQEVTEKNILAAIESFPKIIPGGLKNIRGLYLKTKTSLAVPIFISTESANNIQIPKPTIKKEIMKYEDLSTKSGVRVKVFSDGTVKKVVQKRLLEEDTDEESDFTSIIPPKRKRNSLVKHKKRARRSTRK